MELFLENIPHQMLVFCIFWYTLEQYWQLIWPKKSILFFRFCPIVKSMISLYKLNTRSAGPIFFSINSEILGRHSVGIVSAFATLRVTHQLTIWKFQSRLVAMISCVNSPKKSKSAIMGQSIGSFNNFNQIYDLQFPLNYYFLFFNLLL